MANDKKTLLDQTQEKYRELPQKKKTVVKILFVVIVVLVFLLSAHISGMLFKFSPQNTKPAIYYGIHNNIIVTIVLTIAFAILSYMILMKTPISIRNSVKTINDDGTAMAKNSIYGDSMEASDDELKESFDVCNIKDTYENVYGQTKDSESGEKVIAHKKPAHGGIDEQNVLVIGSPGKGKSFAYVRTSIMQAVLRGNSVVITDPSGELYKSHANWCKSKGIKTYLFNLKEPTYSDCWDCVNEIFDSSTERLSSIRLDTFTRTYYDNSIEGQISNEYWKDSPVNVLKAIIGTLAWRRESAMLMNYQKLFTKVAAEDTEYDAMYKVLEDKNVSFVLVKNMIREEAKKHGYDLNEIEKIFKDIEDNAPSCTFADVFYYVYRFDELIPDLKTAPLDHPAQLAYLTFMNAGDESKMNSILQNLQIKLSLFTDRNLRTICSNDGIDLHRINETQTVVFVATPDGINPLKPIASLFFSFLMTDCMAEYEKAEKQVGAKPRLPVSIILDEMASIGTIGGKTGDGIKLLPSTLATSRKYRLEFSIILQNIGQLADNYNDEGSKTIINCCNYQLFLGAKDPETLKYISDLSGDATAITESHQEVDNSLFSGSSILGNTGSTAMNISAVKTILVTPDQARRLPVGYAYLVGGSTRFAKIKTFPWIAHPAYLNHELIDSDIYQDYMPIEERIKYGKIKEDIYMMVDKDESYSPDYIGINDMLATEINDLSRENSSDDTVIEIDDEAESDLDRTVELDVNAINDANDELNKVENQKQKKGSQSKAKTVPQTSTKKNQNPKFKEARGTDQIGADKKNKNKIKRKKDFNRAGTTNSQFNI